MFRLYIVNSVQSLCVLCGKKTYPLKNTRSKDALATLNKMLHDVFFHSFYSCLFVEFVVIFFY